MGWLDLRRDARRSLLLISHSYKLLGEADGGLIKEKASSIPLSLPHWSLHAKVLPIWTNQLTRASGRNHDLPQHFVIRVHLYFISVLVNDQATVIQ